MFLGWWQVVAGVITQSLGSGTVMFAGLLLTRLQPMGHTPQPAAALNLTRAG